MTYTYDFFLMKNLIIFKEKVGGPLAQLVEPWVRDRRVPGSRIILGGGLCPLYPRCSNRLSRRCFANVALNLEAYTNRNAPKRVNEK